LKERLAIAFFGLPRLEHLTISENEAGLPGPKILKGQIWP